MAAALRCNALLVLGLPLLAFGLARFALRWMTEGTSPSVNIAPRWIKLAAGVLIVFTILRNIPCAPFTYLAPP